MRVNVDGNVEAGWIVDIHDGNNHGAYSPAAENSVDAAEMAIAEHKAKFFPAEETQEVDPALVDPGTGETVDPVEDESGEGDEDPANDDGPSKSRRRR